MKDSEKSEIKRQVIPVIETISADLLTPLAVYLQLAKRSRNSFLLESVEGGESLARYSFIGSEPEMIVSGDAFEVTVRDANGTRTVQVPMLDYLREHFAEAHVLTDEELPAFIGGAIGYFGFDCAGWFEPSLRDRSSRYGSAATFMFFRSVIAFDHAKQVVKICTLVFPEEAGEEAKPELFQKASMKNASIRRVLETEPVELPPRGSGASDASVSSNWTQDEFEKAVLDIKELIRAGECYQVVISQCFTRSTVAHPISIYRAMRSLNPSPYMFLLQMPDSCIIGASPEMLVKCSGRNLEYRPIAGTRPRGKTIEDDSALAKEMQADQKEVAEHLMLVDLGRNDLGRVAEYGSVKVENLMSVEKYSHVQHLVSNLSAKLRAGLDRFDALASCFPAGTVSGAPKVRAIEIIKEMEPTARGVYAGAVGYFDYGGNMDTCIAIRTLHLKDGIAHVQAGAGIVADSVPALEYQETVNKARALLKAIELAETHAS
ncbi:MAG TPA: anthranilate synthase component I family protein [Pyrinomonadaceae bacterium]|nr:anthranilate synthase component I family protein [Pyrinomonadaceae bacterium]